MRLFFVADRVPKNNWSNRCSDAGILFDRCRITEYLTGYCKIPKELTKKIGDWSKAVAQAKGLVLS